MQLVCFDLSFSFTKYCLTVILGSVNPSGASFISLDGEPCVTAPVHDCVGATAIRGTEQQQKHSC